MPQNGACNLGSINLSEFVKSPYTEYCQFDFEDFKNTVRIAIRALDDVLDYGADLHALPEQREMAKNYRNIGLGVMGLGSMLFKMGFAYGSDEAICITEKIGYEMFRTAVQTSVELAKEKGTFPKYKDVVFDSEIMKAHFTEAEIEEMQYYGLRNCSLLSIAPSGSIGTLLNITTGCEPAFRVSYKRKTESLHKDKEVYYDVLIKEAQEFKELYPNKDLPDYFVASDDISWSKRIRMQATLQRHIDTAISSTINLPNNTTVDEVEQLYLFAWENGLKGVTIFRDGCKRLGILTTDKKEEDKPNIPVCNASELPRGYVVNVNDDLVGYKRKLNTGCGSIHFEVYSDEKTGMPQETFINIGSSGGCERNYQFISRLMSLLLRAGVSVDAIIDQAMSIRPCNAYVNRSKTKGDTSTGTSCPSAIGYALKDLQNKMKDMRGSDELNTNINNNKAGTNNAETKRFDDNIPRCPECGSKLQLEGGCVICKGDENSAGCGWSKCE